MKKLLIAALLVVTAGTISPALADDDTPYEIKFTPRINDRQNLGTVCIQWPQPLACPVYKR